MQQIPYTTKAKLTYPPKQKRRLISGGSHSTLVVYTFFEFRIEGRVSGSVNSSSYSQRKRRWQVIDPSLGVVATPRSLMASINWIKSAVLERRGE